ncbi:MAG TPA: hypothetical protein VNJ01_11380 [Bacteriovoracaceae bacterium]|nr:hypothetical protein [Bacteriovoracaceae bacterium]
MVKEFLIFLFLVGCSQLPKKTQPTDGVSLDAALNQAQMSYLKGCVEAYKILNQPSGFDGCVDRAKGHRSELDGILYQEVK